MNKAVYYIHPCKYLSLNWTEQTRYKITPERVLKLLGFYPNFSEQDLVSEMVDETEAEQYNDVILWDILHREHASKEYSKFKPNTVKMDVGLCVNGENTYLACTPHGFTWSGSENTPGLVHYKCPFSQKLPNDLSSSQEIVLAYTMGVLGFTRNNLDYVCWTPSSTILKEYNSDMILLESSDIKDITEKMCNYCILQYDECKCNISTTRKDITLKNLYSEYILPKVLDFIENKLKPALVTRGINLESVNKIGSEYTPINYGSYSFKELIKQLK